jgi:hypothetical protein
LPHTSFSGGYEANTFLSARGFEVVPKTEAGLALILYEDYSREDVHDIFAPGTPFTPQAGTWGMHGIVPIPNRPGDYVFLVTLGQQTGKHIFDEGITEDGVLTWQSQPKQSLNDVQIRNFIGHDELKNSIYFFLRTKGGIPYTYLGRLKYLAHDVEREKPVYFKWQILERDIPQETLGRIGLVLTAPGLSSQQPNPTEPGTLEETSPPPLSPARPGQVTTVFRSLRGVDFAERDARNRELGRAGEELVLRHETDSLIAAGRADLVAKVYHTAKKEGDGAGYDILSITPDEVLKYIEVKTTRGSIDTSFCVTSNELAFSKQHHQYYYLYRVFEYDSRTHSGKLYIVQGDVEGWFNLTAINYRATRS